MRVTIVAVNYNTEVALVSLLNSIRNESALRIDVLIVDNSNSLPLDFFQVSQEMTLKILKPEKNLGYLGGFHYALNSDAFGQNMDYVLLANPDIRFERFFFSALKDLTSDSETAVFAPEVVAQPAGIRQNPFMRRRPTALWVLVRLFWHSNIIFYRFYEALSLARKALKFNKLIKNSGAAVCEDIYAPHGSLLVFSGAFLRGGWLPPYFGFLYGEEIFVAERVMAASMKVTYCRELIAFHDEHVSTRHMASRTVVRCSRASLWGLYKTYFKATVVSKSG